MVKCQWKQVLRKPNGYSPSALWQWRFQGLWWGADFECVGAFTERKWRISWIDPKGVDQEGWNRITERTKLLDIDGFLSVSGLKMLIGSGFNSLFWLSSIWLFDSLWWDWDARTSLGKCRKAGPKGLVWAARLLERFIPVDLHSHPSTTCNPHHIHWGENLKLGKTLWWLSFIATKVRAATPEMLSLIFNRKLRLSGLTDF